MTTEPPDEVLGFGSWSEWTPERLTPGPPLPGLETSTCRGQMSVHGSVGVSPQVRVHPAPVTVGLAGKGSSLMSLVKVRLHRVPGGLNLMTAVLTGWPSEDTQGRRPRGHGGRDRREVATGHRMPRIIRNHQKLRARQGRNLP